MTAIFQICCLHCKSPLIESVSRNLICSRPCERPTIRKPLATAAARKALWCHYLGVPIASRVLGDRGSYLPHWSIEDATYELIIPAGSHLRETSACGGLIVALRDAGTHWQADWYAPVERGHWQDLTICTACMETTDGQEPCCGSRHLKPLASLEEAGLKRFIRRQEQLGRQRFHAVS